MFSFATLALPAYSVASSSRTGASILHGPHHSAQKSTSTGTVDLRTSCSQLASVIVTIFCDAIYASIFPDDVEPLKIVISDQATAANLQRPPGRRRLQRSPIQHPDRSPFF